MSNTEECPPTWESLIPVMCETLERPIDPDNPHITVIEQQKNKDNIRSELIRLARAYDDICEQEK